MMGGSWRGGVSARSDWEEDREAVAGGEDTMAGVAGVPTGVGFSRVGEGTGGVDMVSGYG